MPSKPLGAPLLNAPSGHSSGMGREERSCHSSVNASIYSEVELQATVEAAGVQVRLWGALPALISSVGILLVFGTTYVLTAVANPIGHRLHYPSFFLSSTINYTPSANVGSLGLTIVLFWSTLLVVVRYVWTLRAYALQGGQGDDIPRRRCRFCCCTCPCSHNRAELFLGVTSAIGGCGVAACPVHEVAVAHYTFASVFFGSFVLYSFLACGIDTDLVRVGAVCKKVRFVRRCVSSGLGFLFVVGIVGQVCAHMPGVYSDPPTPAMMARRDAFKALAATVEIIMMLLFVVLFGTFVGELQDFDIVLRLEPRRLRRPS